MKRLNYDYLLSLDNAKQKRRVLRVLLKQCDREDLLDLLDTLSSDDIDDTFETLIDYYSQIYELEKEV